MAYANSTYPPKQKQQRSIKPVINLWPTNGMNSATGYGRMEIGLAKGLAAAGGEVALSYPDWLGKGAVTLVVGSPEWCARLPKGSRVWCFTMSESTSPSPGWVMAMNTHCERVLVPCPPLVKLYEDAGVTVPVQYVPLGMDWNAPAYVARDPQPEVFTWLTYSLGDMRKGAELAMLAFNKLYAGNKQHRMIVKCRDNPQWLLGLKDEQIEVLRGETTAEEWHQLLARCNAFVYPSRGEGWGYPPREAALSGMPTIATAALGMWDAGEWGYGLPVKELRPAQFDFWEANAEGSLWWEPDSEMLLTAMQDIATNYAAVLAKAKRARRYLLDNFTWQQVGTQILEMLA